MAARNMKRVPRTTAQNSHRSNDIYMDNFENALKEMGISDANPRNTEVSTCRVSESISIQGAKSSFSSSMHSVDDTISIARAWNKGPRNPEGSLLDFSDRNLLTLSMNGSEVAVGGSDHSVHTFNVETGRKDRSLHSKIHGHADWVSCVSHSAPNTGSRIVSGGGDGKVCLWNVRGVACEELNPRHDAPVSVLKCDCYAPIAVSASYDKSIRLWSLPQDSNTADGGGGVLSTQSRIRRQPMTGRKRAREFATLRSHAAPVMCLTWSDSAVMMSGDRDGMLMWHDLRTGQKLRQARHGQGHVTCTSHTSSEEGQAVAMEGGGSDSGLFLSGGQDGCVRLYDLRQEQCVANLKLHTSKKGTGALVDVIPARGGVIVSAGADNRICVLDMRTITRRAVFDEKREFIYCMAVWGDVILSGGGDGMVMAHDLEAQGEGKGLLWGLGAASEGAVRAIGVAPGRMTAACDDGNVMVYNFDH